MIYITAVHVSGGTAHNHVSQVMWLNGDTGKTGKTDRAGMVDFIERGNRVQVGGVEGPAYVGVVKPSGGTPHLRTYRDNEYNDNLLALPRY